MPGALTTHVLDTARGRPAVGMRLCLHRIEGAKMTQLAEGRTNDDGRTEKPLLFGANFAPGTYQLTFHAGDYLRAQDPDLTPFLDQIPIRFEITETSHYHVPLLLSPFGYSTYRGS